MINGNGPDQRTIAELRCQRRLQHAGVGVRVVANESTVRPASAHLRTDQQLAGSALLAPQWAFDIPNGRLRLTVDDVGPR